MKLKVVCPHCHAVRMYLPRNKYNINKARVVCFRCGKSFRVRQPEKHISNVVEYEAP